MRSVWTRVRADVQTSSFYHLVPLYPPRVLSDVRDELLLYFVFDTRRHLQNELIQRSVAEDINMISCRAAATGYRGRWLMRELLMVQIDISQPVQSVESTKF